MILQKIKRELAMTDLVLCDQMQNLPKHWLGCVLCVFKEIVRLEVFAHHVASEETRDVVVAKATMFSADFDDLSIGNRPVSDCFQILIQDMEMFVGFVKLNAIDRGSRGIVPQEIKRPRGEDRKE